MIPVLNNVAAGFVTGDIADMFGLPVGVSNTHGINALPFRCCNKVYNEWFRPEYIIDPVDENIGDGPDDYADYVLLRRAKRLDYFTGALPWPQRGPAVDLPLVGNAPVFGNGPLAFTNGTVLGSIRGNGFSGVGDIGDFNYQSLASTTTGAVGTSFAYTNSGTSTTGTRLGVASTGSSGLYADLSEVSAFTINSMRQSFQIQRLLERDARGGTRYTEIIRAHFGVFLQMLVYNVLNI